MSLNMLSGLLSQRHGMNQSIASSVINAIMGHMMQQQGGIGNLFSSGNNYSDDDRMGGIQSSLSNLMGGGSGGEYGQLQQDHPLVQYVQQNAGIQDPQQATEYTQHALSLMNEHANNNPQGLHSLFSNLFGG
jgi:hypothetical protein